MRGWLLVLAIAACGGPAVTAPPAHVPVVHPAAPDRTPVDPIAALAPSSSSPVSWLVPGVAQLELGGATIDGVPDAEPVAVALIDEQGNFVRAAVRLEAVRFSLWADRSLLLSILKHAQIIGPDAGTTGMPNTPAAVVHAGTGVHRLAHRNHWTQIRYAGAVEIEGWVPDSALSDRGPPHDVVGRIPTGRPTLMVVPGAVIRSEPQWAGRQLAVMANGYFVDQVRQLDPGWVEIEYVDGDVAVHGFLSPREPPGRIHRHRVENPPIPVVTTAKVASGTCLYARVDGEPIGYIVGDRPVALDDAGRNWWTLAIDTPWGPLAFAAHGPSAGELVPCAPPNTVPPPVPPTAP